MKTTGTTPDIEILFEDNHLLAVNKPVGLLSQEDHTGQPDLLSLCKHYLKQEYNKPGKAFLGLVHRLDKPVSGIMLLAKTSKAASRLSEQIRQRTIKKNYFSVVEGKTPGNGMLQDYLSKNHKTNTVQVVSAENKKGKKAELIYVKKATSGDYSLLNVTLITGRPHQIRVQLSNYGYPIYGDKKYGSTQNGDIALHAYSLTFDHPISKQRMSVEAELPTVHPWKLF